MAETTAAVRQAERGLTEALRDLGVDLVALFGSRTERERASAAGHGLPSDAPGADEAPGAERRSSQEEDDGGTEAGGDDGAPGAKGPR